MKTYHHNMLVLKLLLSAVMFKLGSALLGSAAYNQRRLNELNFRR